MADNWLEKKFEDLKAGKASISKEERVRKDAWRKRMEAERKRLEQERRIEEERQRIRREAEDRLLAEKEVQERVAIQQSQEYPKNSNPVQTEEPMIRHCFWVKGRKQDFIELRAFLISHQMPYGKANEVEEEQEV